MAASPTFDSHPSEAELIDSYLRPWVVSGTKVAAFVHQADVYAFGPDDLTNRFAPATARDGQEAWYFFTKLRLEGGPKGRVIRIVDTWEGSWIQKGSSQPQPEIGRRQTFGFGTKDEDGDQHQIGWRMMEFRLNPDHGQEENKGPIVLCKVYRSRLARQWLMKAKADDGSPVAAMAGAPGRKEVDEEASAAAGVAGPGCEDEETDSDVTAAAAGLGLKRKAGDQVPGAETAAPPLGHQKTAVSESAGAATTGRELGGCDDRRASRDAAEEEEVEAPAETEEEEVEAPAETEEPRDPSKPQFFDFLANWDK